ncbi:hypothetical protein HK101_008600 [Irineochytrium annulatum]|nr:hypothetical protein HK101_008600 [Irineochytrium annulatum]
MAATPTSAEIDSLDRYSVIANYAPANPDEIKMSIGQLITIVQSYDDGWVMGRNEHSKQIGLLPRNFLSEHPVPKQQPAGSAAASSLAPPGGEVKAMQRVSSMKKDAPMSKADEARMDAVNRGGDAPPTYDFPPSSNSTSSNAAANPSSSYAASTSVNISNRMSSLAVAGSAGSGPVGAPKSVAAQTAPFAHVTSYPISVIPRPVPTSATSGMASSLLDTSIVSNTAVQSVLSKDELARKIEDIRKVRAARAKVPANIGSFKITVVGDSGIGKTSLIKKFFTIPEITFTDNFPSFPFPTTPRITDLRASTIPNIALKTGEVANNFTIVDTPGFGSQIDAIATIEPVVNHHVQKFKETDEVFERMEKIPNLVRFLNSGSGAHGHVDVCIYGVLHRLKPVDIEYMRRLGNVVNLVPVIVKCDTLKPTEITALKVSVLEEIARAKIPIYGFGLQMSELLEVARAGIPGCVPFAISNHNQMTGGAENEFGLLKDALLFHHADDLRQLTAERFVKWRNERLASDEVNYQAEIRAREQQLAQQQERERVERERREQEQRQRAEQERIQQQQQEMYKQQQQMQERQNMTNLQSMGQSGSYGNGLPPNGLPPNSGSLTNMHSPSSPPTSGGSKWGFKLGGQKQPVLSDSASMTSDSGASSHKKGFGIIRK